MSGNSFIDCDELSHAFLRNLNYSYQFSPMCDICSPMVDRAAELKRPPTVPLPSWFQATRSHLVFQADVKAMFQQMRTSLCVLLQCGGHATSDERRGEAVQLSQLHITKLDERGRLAKKHPVPLCPTLIHAHRLAGRKLPRRWLNAYKACPQMIRVMRRLPSYQAYLAAYREFVRDVIVPFCGASPVGNPHVDGMDE